MTTATLNKTKMEKPKQWLVNVSDVSDTPIEFTKDLLITVFKKSVGEAESLALTIRRNGTSLIGVFSKDIAETKIEIANAYIDHHKQYMVATMLPED